MAGTEDPGPAPDVRRPSDVVPGRPAPWASLSGAARRGLSVRRVVDALHVAGRGLDHDPPAPLDEADATRAAAPTALLDAAVLAALFEEAGEARVVLTRRAASLRRHRGEVALPGGRLEAGERPLHAALREAHEEVGLDPASVAPAAWLSPIVTFASSSVIRPYVGVLASRPQFRPQPEEVDRVFDVALRELVADGAYHEERWRAPTPRPTDDDRRFPISFFEVDGEIVWGATARILTELCCLAVGAPTR